MKFKIKTYINIIIIALFMSAIWLPAIESVLRIFSDENLSEKRVLAECPKFGVEPVELIPAKFDEFYKDHFGFRNKLIKGHNFIKYKMLKGSSLGKVLFGDNGWLYLTKAGIIEDYLGQTPLTTEDLQAWRDMLQSRQDYLASKGIKYLFIIAPNKAMIYPENLPEHIRINKGKTHMDQLVEYLRDNSTVCIVDIRPTLWEVKKTNLVYYPRGTHWNYRGGLIAYSEVCNKLNNWFKDITAMPLSDFNIRVEKRAGDLVTMLGLQQSLAADEDILELKTPGSVIKKDLKLPNNCLWPAHIDPNNSFAYENPLKKHSMVLFHDSFGCHGGFDKYLAEHFKRTTPVAVQPNHKCLELIIEQEKPDIVIQEMAERKLRKVPKKDGAIVEKD